MSIAKKIVGQSAIYFSGTVFSVIVGFFFKIYISRQLGANGLGIYALGMSVVAVLSIFLSWGLGNGLVRFVSKYMAQQNYRQLHTYLKKTLMLTLVLSVISALLMLLFPGFFAVVVLKTPSLKPYLSFFAFLLIINAFISLADQTIRGLQEVRRSILVAQFIRLPIKIVIAVGLVTMGFELRGYLWAEVIAALVALGLLVLLLRKLLPHEVGSLLKPAKSTITPDERRFGNNMLTINTIGLLNSQADKILLALYLNTTELGIYSVVLTITAFVPTILVSVNAIFTPIISQLYTEGRIDELKKYYQLSVKYIFILSFPLIVFLALFREPVLSIFGPEFKEGAMVLLFILIGEFFNIITGSVGMMLNMTGYEKITRNSVIISSVIAVVTYIALIPLIGIIGVGIARMFFVVLQNLINVYYLNRNLKINPFIKGFLVQILLSFLLAAILFLGLTYYRIDRPVGIIISFLIIYTVYIGLGWIRTPKNEFIAIKKLLNR